MRTRVAETQSSACNAGQARDYNGVHAARRRPRVRTASEVRACYTSQQNCVGHLDGSNIPVRVHCAVVPGTMNYASVSRCIPMEGFRVHTIGRSRNWLFSDGPYRVTWCCRTTQYRRYSQAIPLGFVGCYAWRPIAKVFTQLCCTLPRDRRKSIAWLFSVDIRCCTLIDDPQDSIEMLNLDQCDLMLGLHTCLPVVVSWPKAGCPIRYAYRHKIVRATSG